MRSITTFHRRDAFPYIQLLIRLFAHKAGHDAKCVHSHSRSHLLIQAASLNRLVLPETWLPSTVRCDLDYRALSLPYSDTTPVGFALQREVTRGNIILMDSSRVI